MDSKPIELNQEQAVLLKLQQQLSQGPNDELHASKKANSPFFIPPDSPLVFQSHFVTLLHVLQEVQKNVEELVVETEETLAPGLGDGGQSEAMKPKELELRAKQDQKGEKAQGFHDKNPVSEERVPLDAKRLIQQVQEAIESLATPINDEEPMEALFKETISKWKSVLNEIVDMVKSKQQEPAKPQANLPTQIVPEKSDVVVNHETFPSGIETPPHRGEAVAISDHRNERLVPKSMIKTLQAGFEKGERAGGGIEREFQPARERLAEKKEEKILKGADQPILSTDDTQLFQAIVLVAKKAELGKFRDLNAIVMPIFPYIAPNKRDIEARRKKKRKGLWYREEEESHQK